MCISPKLSVFKDILQTIEPFDSWCIKYQAQFHFTTFNLLVCLFAFNGRYWIFRRGQSWCSFHSHHIHHSHQVSLRFCVFISGRCYIDLIKFGGCSFNGYCVFSLNVRLQLHLASGGRSVRFYSLLVVLIVIGLGGSSFALYTAGYSWSKIWFLRFV